MNPEEILKMSLGQYVKKRFAELLKKGTNGEKAYTIAMGEYVKAYVDRAKKGARAKR